MNQRLSSFLTAVGAGLGLLVTGCRTEPPRYTDFPDNPDHVRLSEVAITSTRDRYFYVDGEVNKRGPSVYMGETDLVTAISAAGGFTRFVDQKKIRLRLIHPNGQSETVDFSQASREPGKYPVYPGDKIYVPRH